ncbi:hypothetical protein [Streptomyces seoulensis]|uniref:hypothetical protein n=1 Tax=Streptomyces seoulensis TaxID=73044 RepID=UPI001FCCBE22|nr:hypothetical protein [Streptomyces seoulensis]BDH05412.1 hypothetical protein HEK131_26390 [Streptomyces seoulensis]
MPAAVAAGLLLSLGPAHPAAAEDDGLRFDEAIERVTVSPGAALYLSGGFTNGTDRTLDAVYLQVDLDRQFTMGSAFRNCWYSAADTEVRVNRMTCRLEGAVRPGRSYDLYLGGARIDSEAGNGRITYRVSAERGDAPISPAARRGRGPETLAFTERDSAEGRVRPAPAEPGTPVTTAVEVGGTHDLAVNEVTLSGRPGDVVKGDFFFVNKGPGAVRASFDDEPDNDAAVVVELTVPPALKVVKAPSHCRGSRTKAKGAATPSTIRYVCWQKRLYRESVMSPGQFEHFPFTFRIDRADGTPGRIAMPDRREFKDDDPSDNSAAVKVDIAGAGSGSSTRWAAASLLTAVLALGGGALWLRRRSSAARTDGGDR